MKVKFCCDNGANIHSKKVRTFDTVRDLVGKRLVRAEQLLLKYSANDEYKEDIIEFEDDTGVVYTMFHDQECCKQCLSEKV